MIYLIRHGESTANAGGRTKNVYDVPLTDLGKGQAQAVADSIDMKPDLIVFSPYHRTRETAQPLIEKFPDVPIEKWDVQEFTFLDTEKCQNTTREERLVYIREYLERNDPDWVDGKGAESFNHLVRRVENMLSKLAQISDDKFVIIFTHGLFMSVVLMILKGIEPEMADLFKADNNTMPNCSVIKIEKDKFCHIKPGVA